MARDFVLVFVSILLGAVAASSAFPQIGLWFLITFIVVWAYMTRRP